MDVGFVSKKDRFVSGVLKLFLKGRLIPWEMDDSGQKGVSSTSHKEGTEDTMNGDRCCLKARRESRNYSNQRCRQMACP